MPNAGTMQEYMHVYMYMRTAMLFTMSCNVLNELCMMLPAGVHNVCLQTYTGLCIYNEWCIPTDNHVVGVTCTICMYPPHPDLIQLINVKAVQELIL